MPKRSFRFTIPGVRRELRVARFEAREGLSELFEVELLLSDGAGSPLDPEELVGREACLSIEGPRDTRHLHGLVARVEQADVDRDHVTYFVTLLPRVHRLLHRADCRIFQPAEGESLTSKEIITSVFTDAGLSADKDYRLALREARPPREYCVQYRESDWAFVSRLMEEDGMYYFFEHHEDRHVLVIADAPSAHEEIPGGAVPFREDLGAMRSDEHIAKVHLTAEVRPDRVTLRDYDFTKPRRLLESSLAAEQANGLAVYDYPGTYTLPASGDHRARVRLQEQQAARRRVLGEGHSPRLVPGSLFRLAEHPRDGMNRRYLVVHIDHRGHEPVMGAHGEEDEPVYENRFAAMIEGVPFRAPRVTPKPVVNGMQSAVVVCPSGEEIETDAHGRVKVHFHWERRDKASCWVRVSQAWAGAGWGAMFIPRRGHEVLIDFLEGDPDRPVLVGCLYHGTHVTPYPLPAEKTKSTIKSSSSPGGEGFNELRFEDKKGAEEIYLHAQRDLNAEVLRDETAKVGHDQAIEVGHDRRKKIGENEAVEIGKHHTERVGGDESLSVRGKRTREVGGDESATISGARAVTVKKDHTETIDGERSLSVGGGSAEHVGGKSVERVDGDRITRVGGGAETTVKGAVKTVIEASASEEVKLTKSVSAGQTMEFVAGKAKITMTREGKVTIEGAEISIVSSGPIAIQGGKLSVSSDGEVSVKGGKVVVKGGRVDLN